MSSPMFDLPDHLWMGVNEQGQGPVDTDEQAFDWVCWCGDKFCERPEKAKPTS